MAIEAVTVLAMPESRRRLLRVGTPVMLLLLPLSQI
jgi:hypothetical protein